MGMTWQQLSLVYLVPTQTPSGAWHMDECSPVWPRSGDSRDCIGGRESRGADQGKRERFNVQRGVLSLLAHSNIRSSQYLLER
jgi:hypothetical protein